MSSRNVKIISDYLQRKGYARPTWDDDKVKIMIELLLKKFENLDLRKFLLDTGERYLVEGNTWEDVFWGVCNERGRNVLKRDEFSVNRFGIPRLVWF